MSLLGDLNFFLGFQISHVYEGIFISQTKYIKEMLNNFKMEDCKPMSIVRTGADPGFNATTTHQKNPNY
jgi:hypothetical protein